MDWLKAIQYIESNKLHKEANSLANKVGDIYVAIAMLYQNIPLTDENISIGNRISSERKKREKEWFDGFVHDGWKEGAV